MRAAVDMLPPPLIERLKLKRWTLGPWQHRLAKIAGALADRLTLSDSPPVHATHRLGLPADTLYRRRA